MSSSDKSGGTDMVSIRHPPRRLVPEVAAGFLVGTCGAGREGVRVGPPEFMLSMPSGVVRANGAGLEEAGPVPTAPVTTFSTGSADVVAGCSAVDGSPAGGGTTRASAVEAGAGGCSEGVNDSDTSAKLHCVAVLTKRRPNPRRAASA